MDCGHIIDRRAVISEQPFGFLTDIPTPPNNVSYGKVFGPNAEDPAKNTFMTRHRGDPRPMTELYSPGFFRLPGEGELVAPIASAETRFSEPTGGNRSKATLHEATHLERIIDHPKPVLPTEFIRYPTSTRTEARFI